jgi:high affinity Mn2+ porin
MRVYHASVILLCELSVAAYADTLQVPGGTTGPASDDRFAVYWQATYTEQESSDFRSPYTGPNSLTPNSGRETTDMTLYAGARLWSGAQLWVNPEMDQGFGLDDTTGVAGFTSAEAFKIGRNAPYFRLQRAFVRETINLGGGSQTVEGAPNQFAGQQSSNRLVFTVGKFSVVDVFDTNDYAHDPRHDFLNWSVVDTGTFDYAADSWGYTVGGAAEWYQGPWTLRGGIFDLSNVPNSPELESGFDEFQIVTELERRFQIGSLPGKVLLTGFDSRARMGLLNAAVSLAQQTDEPVNIAAVRSYRTRLGVAMSAEQQISSDLGAFMRLGKDQGNVETYEFTDIDRTVAAGLSLKGTRWSRPEDTVALAWVDDGASGDLERYLNAGGLGIVVGDGRLPHPGPEEILESYYQVAVIRQMQITFDYQYVNNPAYNRDRGPASIWAIRLHAEL